MYGILIYPMRDTCFANINGYTEEEGQVSYGYQGVYWQKISYCQGISTFV
jgi:hypothetical protein